VAAEVPQDSPELLNISQAAKLVGVNSKNMDKWLERRGITPAAVAPRPVGRLYGKAQLEAARDEWLAEGGDAPGGRAADEKRRAAALAKRD